MLGVLTSTLMTHFSISKGLRMVIIKEGEGVKWESSAANHVNLKQATNPGGFLLFCGAMPYCHLFFHFPVAPNL